MSFPQYLGFLLHLPNLPLQTVRLVRLSYRDMFLSHRSIDRDFVRNLAGDIEAESYQGRGFSAWVDEAEIRLGQSIPGMIN